MEQFLQQNGPLPPANPGAGIHPMTNEELQTLLSAMLESGEGVSDCLFVVGKPPLIERYGKLYELPMDAASAILRPGHTQAIADLLMNRSPRLISDLAESGSCDTSYAIEGVARFRVNIYRQSGHVGLVMRKLQSSIPTIADLGLPEIFNQITREK
ncbi:MAG: twitching motility protein, partial [Chthoniobacterales bacterium]